MTIDKRMSYEMQGGKKPARNYLGKQKTVSNVPVKWKSGPDAPETELAYITKAEKDLLLKKNLHGSLKNGPNTGPDDIMSLDSQGDYTRDRSPGAYSSGPAGSGTGNTQQDLRNRAMNEKHMRELLTGQKNIGQTVKTGPRTRQYSNLPEYMKVKQKDGTYKDKYIGSAYKSYGTPSFWGNLFSRGAPGYRGIKGLSAFGTPTFEATQGPDGWGYYTDDTDFGETRGAMPFGIMGLLSNIFDSFKKPKDMTEFNKLGLFGEVPEDFNRNRNISTDMGDSVWSDGTFTWGGTTPTSNVPMGTPWDNPYKPPMGTPWDNPYQGPGKYEQAADNYWSDKQIINTPAGEIVIDSQGNEVVDMPTAPMGTPWDNPYREPTVIEDIFEGSGVDPMYQSASLPGNNLMAGLTEKQKQMLEGPQKNLRNILGTSDEEILENITPFNDPNDPATLKDIQTFYGANGGLASLFNRRG